MKVLVSDKLAPEGLEILKQAPGLSVDVKTGMKPEELAAVIGDYDALAIRSATKASKEIIEAGKKLRVIGRAGIGVDNVDVPTATRRGIVVMNTPGGNAVTTAEHAVSLMLALARKIPQAYRSMKEKKWEKGKFEGVEVMGKTLGVVGLGNIGSIVANRGLGLKMKVIGYDPFVSKEVAEKMGVEMVSLDELFARSDFITLHVPKNEETKNLIRAETIAKMKTGVRIINASRGGIVNEKDLIEAIKAKKVAGAALDVFEKEPPEFSGELWELEQVIFTPHLGASTGEALVNVSVGIARQMVDYLLNGIISNAVNFPSVSKELLSRLSPYINLSERMGKLAGQLLNSLHGLEVEYSGEVAELDTRPITHALLKGLLESFQDEPVNYVNAPALAKAKGISVREGQSHEAGDFRSLIKLAIKNQEPELSEIFGTIFGKNDPRIVRIGKISLDASPTGFVLVIRNHDKPGVIGNIGSVLARFSINIGRFQLGRESGEALSMVNTDQVVPEAVIEEIRRLPNIISVKQVNLG
jgi:D-3-phosphoglycerate dehydrogenase